MPKMQVVELLHSVYLGMTWADHLKDWLKLVSSSLTLYKPDFRQAELKGSLALTCKASSEIQSAYGPQLTSRIILCLTQCITSHIVFSYKF